MTQTDAELFHLENVQIDNKTNFVAKIQAKIRKSSVYVYVYVLYMIGLFIVKVTRRGRSFFYFIFLFYSLLSIFISKMIYDRSNIITYDKYNIVD